MEDKEKIIKLKKEIKILEKHIELAQPEDWDMQEIYEEQLNGNQRMHTKPDKPFAKWLAKRYDYISQK